jgi:hypothetical protein
MAPRHRTADGIIPARTVGVNSRGHVTELLIGIALLAGWGVLQFGAATASGWIHLALIAGVILVIRGIAKRDDARPPA